jgi:hypothetical protein
MGSIKDSQRILNPTTCFSILVLEPARLTTGEECLGEVSKGCSQRSAVLCLPNYYRSEPSPKVLPSPSAVSLPSVQPHFDLLQPSADRCLPQSATAVVWPAPSRLHQAQLRARRSSTPSPRPTDPRSENKSEIRRPKRGALAYHQRIEVARKFVPLVTDRKTLQTN